MNDKTPVDFEYVSTTHVSHYSYFINSLVLNTSASVIIYLHSDSNPHFNKRIDMRIEGEDYRKWGNDDSYVSDLIAAKVASLFPKDAQPVVKEEPTA